MPVFELVLSSDTINEGRIKINNAFSATTGLWSGSTGLQSLIHNNDTGNIAAGDYSIVAGYNNSSDANSYSSFIFSTGSTAAGSPNSGIFASATSTLTNSPNSAIFGGRRNIIENSLNSVIIGGEDSTGTPTIKQKIYNGKESVIIGGADNEILGVDTGSYRNDSSVIISSVASQISGSTNDVVIGGGFNKIWTDSLFPTIFETDFNNVLGGVAHEIFNSNFCSIIGGGFINGFNLTGNEISGGTSSGIFNGHQNILFSTDPSLYKVTHSSIIGGESNVIFAFGADSFRNTIIGGIENSILSTQNSIILGGRKNTINNASHTNTILAGTGAVPRSGETFTMGYGGAAPSNSSASNDTIALEFTDGSLYYNGGLFPGAADYAEYFEWNDGNTLSEDRTGYFVSLVGEKIEIGNSDVIGVISASPAVAGDSASLVWSGQFLTDEFGRVEKEKYSVYTIEIEKEEREGGEVRTVKETKEIYIDTNNNVYSEQPYTTNMTGTLYDGDTSNKKFVREDYLNKINPSFDINQTYVPREKRPEWSPVGLLGKLYVRTSEVITGNKVSVDANGMAINGTDYHVLKETKAYDGNYGIVQILFK